MDSPILNLAVVRVTLGYIGCHFGAARFSIELPFDSLNQPVVHLRLVDLEINVNVSFFPPLV